MEKVQQKLPIYSMGINVQSLKAHHDQLIAELESCKTKPTVNAVTGTRLSKNANLKILGIPGYQPVVSKRRETRKLRGGVAFYISKAFEFEPIEFETEIESAITRVNFRQGNFKILCVMYCPQSDKMKQFSPDLENLQKYLRSLKDDSMIFGDFIIDTIVESKEVKDYEICLTVSGYKQDENV